VLEKEAGLKKKAVKTQEVPIGVLGSCSGRLRLKSLKLRENARDCSNAKTPGKKCTKTNKRHQTTKRLGR
jgi:hypothetical protein